MRRVGLLALVVAFAGCGGASKQAATPGEDGGECRAVGDTAEPMVVDLGPDRRVDLEVAMKDGIVVVAYDCKQLRVLPDCHVRGSYGFVGTTEKEQVVTLEGEGEIRANLPFSGRKLASSGALDVTLATVGKRRTTWTTVRSEDLEGSCAGATHFVRGAVVGAFVLKSEKGVVDRDGELAACRKATADARDAPAQCAALLRLDLVAIGAAKVPDEILAACPEGLVMARGKCTKPTAGTTHVCAYGDQADCAAQCDGGDASSCSYLGMMHWSGNGAPKDAARAVSAFRKGCDGGVPAACSNLGAAYQKGLGVARDDEKAFELFKRACDAGNPAGCGNLGVAYHNALGVPRDDDKAFELLRVGCEGGRAASCFDEALFFAKGWGMPRDPQKAAELYQRACDGGDGKGCSNLGVQYDEGKDVTKDPKRAFRLYQRACELGEPVGCYNVGEAYELGKGVSRDVGKARTLYRRACDEGVPEGCTKVNELGP